MKKVYKKPAAEKVVFDYSENVTACSPLPPATWEKTMVSNENYTCDSSYKDANGICGFNGLHTSNPNYECTGH